MVLNAMKSNLDLSNVTCYSMVLQKTKPVVSKNLLSINIDLNGFTNIPWSYEVLQHPLNAASNFKLHDGDGVPEPNLLGSSGP